MADIDRIKNNVRKMLDQEAPESDVDQYLSSEGVTPEQLRAAPKPTGFIDTAVDMGRTIPGGVAKGINSVVGLPGDLENLLGRGVNAGLNFATGQNKEFKSAPLAPPTSETLNKVVSAPTGGFYEPKTMAGEYTETAASFLPAAIGGGGGLGSRAARVIGPAVTSETGGQLTKGTPYEPYARAAGALLGGVAVGGTEGALEARKAIKSAPTNADLGTEASNIYKAAKAAGVNIKATAYDDMVDDVLATVKSEGTHPKLHPKLDGVLDSLKDVKGADIELGELERLRRVAQSAARSIDADERRIAGIVLDKVDDFMEGLDLPSVTSGDPAVAATLSEARGLWSKMRKSQTIDELVERASTRATAQNGNIAGALRQEFGTFARNKKNMRGFTAQERKAITEIARAGPTKSAIIGLGALRPRGLVAAVQSLGGGMALATNPMAALPIAATAAAGQVAQSGLNAATKQSARLASALMRSGGKPMVQQTASPSRDALISALFSQAGH